MKVLIISHRNPFRLKDGGSIGIYFLLKCYRQLGYDTTLLMMNPLKHYIPPEEYIPMVNELGINVVVHDINTNPNPFAALKNLFFSNLSYILERFYDKEYESLLIDLLKKNKYDLVQLEGSQLALYLDTIKKYAPDTPIALRAHNVEYEIWERTAKTEKNILKKWFYKNNAIRFKKWEIEQFRKVDFIFPVSVRDEKCIREFAPTKKYYTINFGIDLLEYPKQIIDLKNISIAFLGALDWIPNQEALVWFLDNVWSRIDGFYEGLEFYIAGRRAPEWLVKKIKGYNVNFVGEVDSSKQFITQHPIFVVPLMAGGGVRIKIIEQMALGRVIISTPIGAEGLEVMNGENIMIAETSDDFIRDIDYLLRNPDGIRYISENARITVENLYNEKVIFSELDEYLSANLLSKS